MSKKKCVFGPVQSRRLGVSLGIDLLPFKTCSMDCVYCECGATTNLTLKRAEYVPTEQVLAELDEKIASGVKPDYITFSGAGEPTLHTGIGRIISHIKAKHAPCKVCLLTNSTTLPDKEIARSLSEVDLIVPSLDGSNEEEFAKVTRAAPGVSLEAVVEGIASFKRLYKAVMWLEIFIVPGVNDSPASARRFRDLVARIKPDKAQLNSLDRPGAEKWVQVPSRESLDAIAAIIGEAAPVESVGRRVGQAAVKQAPPLSANELNSSMLDMLSRRPCTAEDVAATLGITLAAAQSHLSRMEREGLLAEERGARGVFYRDAKA